ncbi:MAG: GNAT family N-acetyltransferase [Bacteriovoracaceae bacterium]
MKRLTHIEICNGHDKRVQIEAFYEAEGRNIEVRGSDLFFIAYSGKSILGCVRFCIEHDVPMLRTMRVAQDFQRQDVGSELLRRFVLHLNDQDIHNTYCLPYSQLEKFYGSMGFKKISAEETPEFLRARISENAKKGNELICMRRD